MQASSNDSDNPPETQQQQYLVTQLEHEKDPGACLDEDENRHRQQADFKGDEDSKSNLVSTPLDRMPPHSAHFPPLDQDFVTSSSNEPQNKPGQEGAAVPPTRQQSFSSSCSSSWTCSSDELLFPTKLFCMLNDAHEKGFEHIVSWGHGPSSFNVHQKKAFEDQVLPKYFKMTKYKSFTRQLHNYEFQWIRGGPDKGGYCHKYFSRDGTNVDQLLSRKAIALAQTNIIGPGSERTPRNSTLPIEGIRRWSAPDFLEGGGSQQSSEDGKPKPSSTNMLPPLNSSSSCTSLLEAHHQHRVELKRCESDPMNVSTHSGGYLLPPLVAPLWRATPLGSPLSELHQERSMTYSNHGVELYSVNQQDALNPFLTISATNMGLLNNSQDSLHGGRAVVMPTTTLSGTGLLGDLSAASASSFVHDPKHSTPSLRDLVHPHHALSIPGIQGCPPLQFLAGGGSTAPSSSSPTLPATMMMDRDDVLVNRRQSSVPSPSFLRSSPALGVVGTTSNRNPGEKFSTLLFFKDDEETGTTVSTVPPNTTRSQDGMDDDETPTGTFPSLMEPRTIEEMMQDDDHPFR